jgi:hypothetical protein
MHTPDNRSMLSMAQRVAFSALFVIAFSTVGLWIFDRSDLILSDHHIVAIIVFSTLICLQQARRNR